MVNDSENRYDQFTNVIWLIQKDAYDYNLMNNGCKHQ